MVQNIHTNVPPSSKKNQLLLIRHTSHNIETHKRRRRERNIVYCYAVPDKVLYLCRTNEEATVTAVATEREEDDVLLCLSFVWFPRHWTMHYSSHPTYNTDSTSSRVVVILSSSVSKVIRTYQCIHTLISVLYVFS